MNITLTASAASRIKEILRGDPGKNALRVAVNGGGCSGFQYDFKLDSTRNDDDIIVERDGASVLIDSVSLGFMEGSEIDFVDDLIGQAFKIKNPLAKASCGCGTSFTI
jgi:iron-sulfur cluster insertion protein